MMPACSHGVRRAQQRVKGSGFQGFFVLKKSLGEIDACAECLEIARRGLEATLPSSVDPNRPAHCPDGLCGNPQALRPAYWAQYARALHHMREAAGALRRRGATTGNLGRGTLKV